MRTIMKSVALFTLAVCLCITASCERSCPSEMDKSLAGMIVSRDNPCHCFFDGIEIQPWYEISFDVSKEGNDKLIINVYGETMDRPQSFPPGGPVWNISSGPFSVKGNDKTVNFNDNINLTLRTIYKDGSGKDSFVTMNANIQGWITNSSIPVTRTSDEICLQFDILISWSKDGEQHFIRLADTYGEV